MTKSSGKRKAENESGFTLLELAVVLTIIALVTAMAMTSGIAVVATARQSATVQKMAAIDKALMAFRVANNRLPCPADLTIKPGATNYGVEAGAATPGITATTTPSSGVGNGVCSGTYSSGSYVNTMSVTISGTPTNETVTPAANFYSANVVNPNSTGMAYANTTGTAVAVNEGGVPTVALGLPNDFMYDGWGNRIRYAVDSYMTTTGSFTAVPVGALCGSINICDSGGYSGTYPSGTNNPPCTNLPPRSSAAIYALISHGANGYGAYTQNGALSAASSSNTNEQTNCHYSSGTCAASGTQIAPVYVQQSPGYQSSHAGNPLYYFDDIVTFKERWQMQTPWDRQGTACPAIWLTDGVNNRMEKFDMNANYLFQFGSTGTGYNELKGPKGLASDANGNIWVADFNNYRVEEIDSNGNYKFTIGGGGSYALLNYGIVGCTAGTCVLGNTAGCTACTSASSCTCISGSSNGQLFLLLGIAIDPSGNIWVADEGNNRVEKFNSSGQWLMTIGGDTWTGATPHSCTGCLASATSCTCNAGSGDGQLGPEATAVDPSGNIWVLDETNNRVEKFSPSGQWLLSIGGGATCTSCVSKTACTCAGGYTNGMFSGPFGIASDANGNIWVADTNNNRVQEFNNTGTWLLTIPASCPNTSIPACPASATNGQFRRPSSIAFDANGNIWVADANNGRVEKFGNIASTWTWQQSFGSTGSGPGQFSSTVSIAIAR